MSDSMYLIIEANNLQSAKAVLRQAIIDIGLTDENYKFLVGERNIGFANGKVIKNNTVLSEIPNGNYLFEFDREIVAQHNDIIDAEVKKNSKTHWCTKETVQQYLPSEVV